MATPRKKPLAPVALSLAAAHDALQCRLKTLQQAVDLGLLPLYREPGSQRSRVLIVDLIKYIRENWPRDIRHRRKL